MSKNFQEILWLAEYPGKESVIIASEDIFKGFSPQEKKKKIDSLITLGLDKLAKDYKNVDPYAKIPVNDSEKYSHIITGFSFLMNKNKEFDLFILFGGKADAETTLQKGILHAMKILKTVQNN